MDDRAILSVMRLPRIDPPFAEDQRWRDGCMMPPITRRERVVRQLFPRYETWDCCLYHGQRLHEIASAVLDIFGQIRGRNFEDEEEESLLDRRLRETTLDEAERLTAYMLLSKDNGIHLWRPPGARRWTYREGRHRARALMDAGVRRIVVTSADERRLGD